MHVFTLHKDHLKIHQRPHIEKCLEAILGPNYEQVRSRMTPASKDLFVTDKHATPSTGKKRIRTAPTSVCSSTYIHASI